MTKSELNKVSERAFIPVFCQPWYLDAMCGQNNWEIVSYSKNGNLIAFLPYFHKKKLGISYVTMPEVTLFMGPIIFYPENTTYYKRCSLEKEAISELLKKLPKFFKVDYMLHHNLQNFAPFHWAGFNIVPRITYEIKHNTDLQNILSRFNSSTKRQVKKGQANLTLERNQDIDSFISINKLSYKRQKVDLPYQENKLKALHQEAQSRNNCILQFALDKDKNIHASNFLLWDNNDMYYYLSGMNPEYKDSGAQSFLIAKAIELAYSKELNFNFYGSMQEGIERFFRSFGAEQKFYFHIKK